MSGNDFKTVNRTNLPKNASSQAVWREDRTLRIITDVRRPVSQGSVQPTAKHTKVQEKGTDQDRLNLAPLSRATSFQKLAKSTTTALMDRTPNVRGRVLSAPLQDKTKSVADASEESFLPANRGAISPTVAERRLKNSMELYLDGKSENKPTNRWFVPVLVAWRLSKQPEAPEKCSSLLRHMFQLSKSLPNCQPTLFAVNVSILVFRKNHHHDDIF